VGALNRAGKLGEERRGFLRKRRPLSSAPDVHREFVFASRANLDLIEIGSVPIRTSRWDAEGWGEEWINS
jgi:hypothetical protein